MTEDPMATHHTHTDGGAVVVGNVEVSGGDFVGRDHVQPERATRASGPQRAATPERSESAAQAPLSPLATALHRHRLLLVWADVPFPPEERAPRSPALSITRWQEAAPALPLLPFDFAHGRPWPLAQLPPLPILSLDPTDRVEVTFRYAGVPLSVARTRRDPPARDRHSLLKLGGDLSTRAGLFLSWDDVRAVPNDPDKAHLLRKVRRWVQGGVVVAMAPSPTAAFARLWRELVAPAVRGAAHHYVLGPPDFAWPAPLVRLEQTPEEMLAALADAAIPPPLESVQAGSLRRQLAEAQANLQLIEERESEYVLTTDVPLQLVKERRRVEERIAELEAELGNS
jgi:hypothetical protein